MQQSGLKILRLKHLMKVMLCFMFCLYSHSMLALNIEAVVTNNPAERLSYVYYKVVVSNTDGVQRDNVVVTATVPTSTYFYEERSFPATDGSCSSNSCSAGEVGTWNLGSIAGGDHKTIIIPLVTTSKIIDNSNLDFPFSVTYTGASSSVSTTVSSRINNAPSAQVSLTGPKQVVEAGEQIEMEISFGNISSSSLTSTSLEATLPSGLSFVSASDGGSLNGSTISWDLNVLNAGTSGKRFFTVEVDSGASDGNIYSIDASVKSNGTELSSGGEVLAVRSGVNLHLDVTVTGDNMRANRYSYFRYVVSNTGNSSLADVSLRVMVPEHSFFYEQSSLPVITSCGSNYCKEGEWGVFSIGQLDAGETRVLTYALEDNSHVVDGEPMVTHAVLTEGSGAYTLGTKPTVLFERDLGLLLDVAASKQVVAADETFEYELSFGNAGSSAVQNLVLEMPLPANTTLVSASDGGTENSGVVSWSLNTLNSGASGKRTVTVQANSGLADGEVLINKAELNLGGPSLARAGESVVIRDGLHLNLDVSVTGDNMLSNRYSYFRYVVSNTGNSSLADVTLQVMVPEHSFFYERSSLPEITNCGSNYCKGGEWGVFSIGQLDAGETRVLTYALEDNSHVEDGEPMITHAILTEGSSAYTLGTKPTVLFESDPGLLLDVAASKQVVTADETFDYELNYGNISSTAVQNLVLEMALPANTSFVAASDGGTESDGLVSWSLNTLNSGVSGKRTVTLKANSGLVDGEVLANKAELNSGGPSLARAGESVVIRAGAALHLDTTITGDNMHGGRYSYFRYVVSNTGSTSLADITLQVMVPDHSFFYEQTSLPTITNCGSSYCKAGEWGVFSIDQLDAGESRVLTYALEANGLVLDGEPMVTHAILTEGSGAYTLGTKPTVLYESDAQLLLNMAASKQVVKAEETFDYELSYGNVSGSALQNLVLQMTLPSNTTFVSASDGGTESGGVVSWNLNTLNSGVAGKRRVTVQAKSALLDGEVLVGKTELNTGGSSLVRAGESVVVREQASLNLDVNVTGDSTNGSEYSYFRYIVSNTGSSSLADVTLRVMVPKHSIFYEQTSLPMITNCGSSYCKPGEWAAYSIGQLGAGETRVLTYAMEDSGAVVDGEPMVTHAVLTEGSGAYTQGTSKSILYESDLSPQLAVTSEQFHVTPGDLQSVKVAVGNPTSESIPNALLKLDLSSGYTLVTASGQFETVGNTVYWPLGNISPNTWVEETVELSVDSLLLDTEVLNLDAVLLKASNVGEETPIEWAGLSALVESAPILTLSSTSLSTPPLGQNSEINFTLTANNQNSVENADVRLYYMTSTYTVAPESTAGTDSCSSIFCNAGEWAAWELGNISAGSSSQQSIFPALTGFPPDGFLLVFNSYLTHTSSPRHDQVLISAIGVGSEFSVDSNHDSDADSIPDWWEIRWGYNRWDASDATSDDDEDGSDNAEEYLEDTYPDNPDTDGDGILDGPDTPVGGTPTPTAAPTATPTASTNVCTYGYACANIRANSNARTDRYGNT